MNNRGTAPRIYRNMLAFIVPDQDSMTALKQETRRYLAWKSIKEDSQDLNLDAAQNRETGNSLSRSNETVELRLKETWCWLLVPYIDRSVDMKTVVWEKIRISGGTDGAVARAAKKMMQNESLVTKWAPALLLMELDNVLWRENDNIAIKKLWEYLCTYCYLPRLTNYEVLEEAIRAGLPSPEYFAYAAAIGENRYIDLKYNQPVPVIDHSGYLVKTDAAQKQIAEAQPAQPPLPEGGNGPITTSGTSPIYPPAPESSPTQLHEPAVSKNTHFYMSAQLDNTRINRDVQRLVEEVISHLTSAPGSQLEVTLEVNVKSSDGLSPQIIRTVSENCRTLKVKDFGFDE